jgi:hypothetical protein
MIKFYSYRISIIEPSKEGSLRKVGLIKEQLFTNQLDKIFKTQKISFVDWGIKHILFFIKRTHLSLYFIELAKEESYTKPVEGQYSIEEIEDVRAPFVYVILDVKRQIILIQDKKSVFQNVDVSMSRMEKFLDDQLEYIGLSILIKPITNKKDVWREIQSMDKIDDFEITLNAPNLFKGRFKANEFVKEVHEEYNFTELKLLFKSKIGTLKLYRENAGEFISLAAAGAGKYIIRARREGKKIIIDSLNFIVQKTYNTDDIKDLDMDKLEEDLAELDELNDKEKDV